MPQPKVLRRKILDCLKKKKKIVCWRESNVMTSHFEFGLAFKFKPLTYRFTIRRYRNRLYKIKENRKSPQTDGLMSSRN